MESAASNPILLAYDGSRAARAAIEEAGRLFQGRPTVVVTVWESAESIAPAAAMGVPAGVVGRAVRELDVAAAAEADRLAEEGAELARTAGLDTEPRAVRLDGNVWATICHLSHDLDAGAVVVGSRGRSGIKSALLGSVSGGVVQHSAVPTVVVRAPEEAQRLERE